MKTCEMSAVLFARNHARVATFYREALGLTCTVSDTDYSALNCSGFDLIVHQIPRHLLAECSTEESAQRRTGGSIRLNFPVDSVTAARTRAAALGGQVDDQPPPWAAGDTSFFLGSDPEGNVFGISERSA
ncbi:MAG TPA: VOC family protein [Povalibacter sp.]|nr:VOC family protein [Povalibacter sp.]